jgi:RNA polymerase sigma factor for flagellar operon FliA
MADIATDLGVTESRISQLRTEALIMLREGLAGQHAADDVASAPHPQRPGSAVTSLVNHADKVAADKGSKRPSRREAARQAYIAAIASRSTLAGRLAATTTLGDTRTESLEALRAAQ